MDAPKSVFDWRTQNEDWLKILNQKKLNGETDEELDKFIRSRFHNRKFLQEASPKKLISQLPLAASKDGALVINIRPKENLELFLKVNGLKNLEELRYIFQLKRKYDKKIQFTVRQYSEIEKLPYIDKIKEIFLEFNSPIAPILDEKSLGIDGFINEAKKEFRNFKKFNVALNGVYSPSTIDEMREKHALGYALFKYKYQNDIDTINELQNELEYGSVGTIARLHEFGRITNRLIVPLNYHIIEQQSFFDNSQISAENRLKYNERIANFLVSWFSPNVTFEQAADLVIEKLDDLDFYNVFEDMMLALQQSKFDEETKQLTKDSHTKITKSTKTFAEFEEDLKRKIMRMDKNQKIIENLIGVTTNLMDFMPREQPPIDLAVSLLQVGLESNQKNLAQKMVTFRKPYVVTLLKFHQQAILPKDEQIGFWNRFFRKLL